MVTTGRSMSTETETLQVSVPPWWHSRRQFCNQVPPHTLHSTLSYPPSTPSFVTTAPLAVQPVSTPWRLLPPPPKKLGEILYLLICSFLRCLSWLLRCRIRRDLWIALYIYGSSVWHLLCDTLLALRIWKRHLYFWKICAPLVQLMYGMDNRERGIGFPEGARQVSGSPKRPYGLRVSPIHVIMR
jgi:hypothetical protein